MDLSAFAQEDVAPGYAGVQEGLDLLKAYSGISDAQVREKILAWVLDVHAASTGALDQDSPVVDSAASRTG